MGIFFRNKGHKVNYIDTLNGQEAEIYFPYLTGTIRIVCEIDLNMSRKEKIIVIPSYDIRINRFTELRYGERDFVDDVKMMLKFLENSPKGEDFFICSF